MNYTHQKELDGYAMAEHRIMTFPRSMQSCGSCHSLILRCVLIEKVTQLPVIYIYPIGDMGLKRNGNSV